MSIDIFIAGAGIRPFGKHLAARVKDLSRQDVAEALADRALSAPATG
jgi:acetyl-CoA acetyltransferase